MNRRDSGKSRTASQQTRPHIFAQSSPLLNEAEVNLLTTQFPSGFVGNYKAISKRNGLYLDLVSWNLFAVQQD